MLVEAKCFISRFKFKLEWNAAVVDSKAISKNAIELAVRAELADPHDSIEWG